MYTTEPLIKSRDTEFSLKNRRFRNNRSISGIYSDKQTGT